MSSSLVCIYNGPGAADVSDYQNAYSKILSKDYNFQYINATDIIEKDILTNCELFVMPGGADLPYCEALNGTGNNKIKAYVERGGKYLGTCAGAYYGSAFVLYDEKDQVNQRIKGPRALKFCPGVARGPLFQSIPHAEGYDFPISVPVCLNKGLDANYTTTDKCCSLYYFGGPFFCDIGYFTEGRYITILADYWLEDTEKLFLNPEESYHYSNKGKSLPAIVYTQVKRGKAVLTGVHLENSLFDKENNPQGLTREKLLKIIFKKLGLKTKK